MTPEEERAELVTRSLYEIAAAPEGRALLNHILGNAQPSIMDATWSQLVDADRRARAAVAAMDVVLRRWTWGDAHTLGELMPQLPEDVRDLVAEHLVRAGLS